MGRKLEVAANVAILIVAVLAGVLLVRNLMAPKKAAARSSVEIPAGTKLPLPFEGKTAVLALSTNCHYCTESAPFYRRLSGELAKRGVHLTIVMPQPPEEGRGYVRGLGLDAADVRQVSLRALNIRGTPTLLLVDKGSVVSEAWVGMLTPEREQDVVEAVRKF
ncbi:MAG TPA: hypothetical protein VF618_22540 [Thermoanaerobaculia bacterium]